MIGKLISFGYALRGAEAQLEAFMAEDERALIVDIRYEARSRIPAWNSDALKRKWGDRYWPLSALGNVNYNNSQPIRLSMPDIGIPLLVEGLQKQRNLVLLCACIHYEQCHRRVVVELVKETLPGVEVILL